MDFTRFSDIAVIDAHIHFPHPDLMDGVLEVLDTTGMARANLVATPDLQLINHNPALIHFKASRPERVTICGALDYTQVFADPGRAGETLAAQIGTLKGIGFDGLKFVEGKPMIRKMIPLAFDGPEYAGMWAALEEHDFPVVFHVADPEEFWDAERCPDWARAQGWFYDDSYPAKEDLYAEVDRVLARHPGLRIIFAHFYFLSADLARAGDFLDTHPNVFFDLTPGVEMYFNFAVQLEAARDFFLRYQDQLIYGTDIGASAISQNPSEGLDMLESLGRAWVVRRFLETDEVYDAPEGVGHWLGMDAGGFHGIGLEPEVLVRIYRANAEKVFGATPVDLDREAALAELERMAAVIDAQAGEPVPSPARQVAESLRHGV
jgi:predicted TIM-barrel fold metal-dependent hydrolase